MIKIILIYLNDFFRIDVCYFKRIECFDLENYRIKDYFI